MHMYRRACFLGTLCVVVIVDFSFRLVHKDTFAAFNEDVKNDVIQAFNVQQHRTDERSQVRNTVETALDWGRRQDKGAAGFARVQSFHFEEVN